MDETVTTTPPDEQDVTTIAIAPASVTDLSIQQTVCDAAAFGWAITELLGRCYLLQGAAPAVLDWSGAQLVLLQETYTPREKIRALLPYIRGLSDALGLSSCSIKHADDPENGRRYIDVLADLVTLFCQNELDPALGLTHEQLRGKINERLFFWDLQIHDALQESPTAVPKAYLVGRTLAGLRWYIGLPGHELDEKFLEKVCQEYVPILGPYVSPYATSAVANSAELWWKAIASGQVQADTNGDAPLELQKQADIWFSLLTNERTSLSFVPPDLAKKSSHYTWRVVQLYWPLLVGGIVVLVVVLALLLLVILSHYDQIAKGIAAAAGFVAALGITHSLSSNLGNILQKATTEVTKGSVINSVRDATQQQLVSKSTYIPPAGVGASAQGSASHNA